MHLLVAGRPCSHKTRLVSTWLQCIDESHVYDPSEIIRYPPLLASMRDVDEDRMIHLTEIGGSIPIDEHLVRSCQGAIVMLDTLQPEWKPCAIVLANELRRFSPECPIAFVDWISTDQVSKLTPLDVLDLIESFDVTTSTCMIVQDEDDVYRPLEWFMSLFVNKVDVSFSSMTTIVPFRKDASQISIKSKREASLRVPMNQRADDAPSESVIVSMSRLSLTAQMPIQTNQGCYKLFASRTTTLEPLVESSLETDLVIQVPSGYIGSIVPLESSLPGLWIQTLIVNQAKHVCVKAINVSKTPLTVILGQPIAQLIISKSYPCLIEPKDKQIIKSDSTL